MKGKTVFAAVCAALAAGGAVAQADPAREAVAPFDALKLSAELARSGEANRDAWALAIAARIRRLTPMREVARVPEGGTAEPAADKSALWLDRAEELGGDDPRLASLVKEVRATAFKGRSGGPQVSRARLAGGAQHRYGEPFIVGRPAVVYVEGDGDTDLGLVVRGPDGNTACAQFGPGDVKLCAWTARAAGRYSVEVSNRGAVANAYALATN
ncbi:MAG: hypothetical protein ACXWVJ_03140 [Caulobacteraceae bacterium]